MKKLHELNNEDRTVVLRTIFEINNTLKARDRIVKPPSKLDFWIPCVLVWIALIASMSALYFVYDVADWDVYVMAFGSGAGFTAVKYANQLTKLTKCRFEPLTVIMVNNHNYMVNKLQSKYDVDLNDYFIHDIAGRPVEIPTTP